MIIRPHQFRGVSYNVVGVDDYEKNLDHPSWYSFQDEATVRDMFWHIAPGDCVLDVGAAYGSYTLTALAQGAARAWAWSPQWHTPEAREKDILEQSLAANGWSDKCTVYASGVYDRAGYLNTMKQAFTVEPPADMTVDVIAVESLGAWFERNRPRRVDWMKLDVEGAEVEVLRSGLDLVRSMQPNILVENHVFKRATIEAEVRDLVLSLGFYREVKTEPYYSVSHTLYQPYVRMGT